MLFSSFPPLWRLMGLLDAMPGFVEDDVCALDSDRKTCGSREAADERAQRRKKPLLVLEAELDSNGLTALPPFPMLSEHSRDNYFVFCL